MYISVPTQQNYKHAMNKLNEIVIIHNYYTTMYTQNAHMIKLEKNYKKKQE